MQVTYSTHVQNIYITFIHSHILYTLCLNKFPFDNYVHLVTLSSHLLLLFLVVAIDFKESLIKSKTNFIESL